MRTLLGVLGCLSLMCAQEPLPTILGSISITGGAAAMDMPASALPVGCQPAATGFLRNDTCMVATDITVHIAPVPGDSGLAPRLRSLRIGGQDYSCGASGVGQWRQVIPSFQVGESRFIEIEVTGPVTCSELRLSFVLSMSPGWAPEVDIAQGVVVTKNAPVVVAKLPFQGDAGVIFWVENASLRPGDEFGALGVDFDLCDEPNSLLTAHVVDEFSLLPFSGIQTELNSKSARFVAPHLLGPLERVAVLCTFQHTPNAGLVIKTRAY